MPTWCHMFNSTLIGNAWVWFDDLPPESIDSYNDLREAFRKNYLQQKKCIRDPIVLHNIKQRDGESTEDFIQSDLRLASGVLGRMIDTRYPVSDIMDEIEVFCAENEGLRLKFRALLYGMVVDCYRNKGLLDEGVCVLLGVKCRNDFPDLSCVNVLVTSLVRCRKKDLVLRLAILGFPSISHIICWWPEWDPCRARIRHNRDCCSELPSADVNLPCFSFIMATITSIKCVLTQEHLDSVCIKYFVPEEVHPQLPGPDNTMHERPSGKVGMYTRFFDYANYRIPFSNFFVSVLVHFRIPFSQLSVFWSAKVSHFEILCHICNIEPSVGLFSYFYTHNYKNGWFGFTKRPNVRAFYSKNLDSVKNWNDHFFWVDEFVVPANARFSWFSGSNIVKDKAPPTSEYNMEHVNTLIAQASPFLRFPEEFLCWVGISRNYLIKKDTYPRFEYENREEMDLNAFIRTADPRKVRFVERPRTKNERHIMTVAKHRTVTLLLTSVYRPSGELSDSIERDFGEDGSGSEGQEDASVAAHGNVRPVVPITDDIVAEADISRPKRSKKKRVIHGSEGTPAASHPPKRLRADYGRISGSTAGGKSPGVLNKLLHDSRLSVEQGVTALPTLPFITSSVTASPLEEGGDHTDSVTGPSLQSVAASARFVVLSDSSHHSTTNSAGPGGDSFVSNPGHGFNFVSRNAYTINTGFLDIDFKSRG
ncbi:gypsy type transposase [Tanacetum coccineum]